MKNTRVDSLNPYTTEKIYTIAIRRDGSNEILNWFENNQPKTKAIEEEEEMSSYFESQHGTPTGMCCENLK